MTPEELDLVTMAARIHTYLHLLKKKSPRKQEELETMIKSFNPEQAKMFESMTNEIEKHWQSEDTYRV